MGRTKERAWRGMDEQKRKQRYISQRKRKIKQAHELLDDDDEEDDDVVTVDPKRKRCELVQNVSSMSDSSLDDDDDRDGRGGDGDAELLDPKQKQCKLVDDDDGGSGGDDDDVELLDPKQKHCELDDDDDDDDARGGGAAAAAGVDGGVELLDPKQIKCELDNDDDEDDVDDDDDDDGDVELLDLKREQHELVENMSPMPVFPEKHSSFQSGIVYVRGYKVKQSIATILEAIFKKHGDIAANCVFKASSTRTHFLEVVCEIVKRIQTSDMTEMVKDNIESKLSDAEAANINVSWIRAHFEAFHKMNETEKKYNLLMEMKSNTMLVKAAAQTDLREICEELMDAQERFEKAERCVRVLHLVEKNISDNILKSKAEIDSLVAHPVV